MTKKVGITEVVLRDGNQSLLSTRLKLEDILPIASKLDEVGYSSIESWGGAIFDSCVRYLDEDPWDRLRQLKDAMPKTKQQMLLRGQNLVGYKHYSDEIVSKFIEKAASKIVVNAWPVKNSRIFSNSSILEDNSPVALFSKNFKGNPLSLIHISEPTRL